MKAFVDRGICIGCEACAGTCPEVFSMDSEGISVPIKEDIPDDLRQGRYLQKRVFRLVLYSL